LKTSKSMNLPPISKKVRLNIAADLNLFARVLAKHGFDNSSIFKGVKKLNDETFIPTKKVKRKDNKGNSVWIDERDATIWEYEISDMQISISNLTSLRHLKPNKIENLTISLSVLCKAHCNTWQKDTFDSNPFVEASMNVLIYGYKERLYFQSGFHFDLCKPNELSSEFIHPSYHLQYSPDVDSIENEFEHGSIILMDSPRIVHPPLDFILGFDYILANFAPQQHQILLKDGDYNILINKYQEKIWRPYYKRLSDFWDSREEKQEDDLWHPQNLLPHLRNR
jgi:hypothetical protein